MTRLAIAYVVAGLAMLPAPALAQNPPAPAPNLPVRRSFEKFTVEGQPVDRRAPELDTDHPLFAGQTHAPNHKTVDVEVTTIADGLDLPWAVELLPSGRFLITEKAGRLRILNKDGSVLQRYWRSRLALRRMASSSVERRSRTISLTPPRREGASTRQSPVSRARGSIARHSVARIRSPQRPPPAWRPRRREVPDCGDRSNRGFARRL